MRLLPWLLSYIPFWDKYHRCESFSINHCKCDISTHFCTLPFPKSSLSSMDSISEIRIYSFWIHFDCKNWIRLTKILCFRLCCLIDLLSYSPEIDPEDIISLHSAKQTVIAHNQTPDSLLVLYSLPKKAKQNTRANHYFHKTKQTAKT